MAQNVIINGVTYQNVPEVDIPKSGGTWKAASRAWIKSGGAWVQQSSMSSVFSAGVNYVRG